MQEKQPQALASGYRRAVGKLTKIKELKITPDMTQEAIDALVEKLAKAKGKEEGKDWKTKVDGQRWYVTDLVKFSGMELNEALEHEYSMAFPDTASEDEMLTALAKLKS